MKIFKYSFFKAKTIINENPLIRRYVSIIFGYARLYSKLFYVLETYNKQFSNLLTFKSHKKSKKILLAGSIGMNPDNLVQSLVGAGLQSKGNLVDVIQCDGVLKGCFNCKYHHFKSKKQRKILASDGPGIICNICTKKGKNYANSLNLNLDKYSNYIKESDKQEIEKICNSLLTIDDIKSYQESSINIGYHAYSGAIRFYAIPDLEKEEESLDILRAYLFSSILSYRIFKRLFFKKKYDIVILDHGIYIPQGVIVDVAKLYKTKVFTFATGYRNKTFIFAKGGSYHHVIPKLRLEDIPKYSSEELNKAKQYINNKVTGVDDWVLFQEKNSIKKYNLGTKKDKINISLFTNVLWDAQIHFSDSIFESSLEWLQKTIKYVNNYHEANLIIRIHPGEKKGFIKSRVGAYERLLDMLTEDELRNTTIIPAESPVNSYELAQNCNFSIVDGSKIGIELCAMGLPVIVAGDCWTKNKGISLDAINIESYYEYINEGIINKGLKKPNINRALSFAYYLYFDSMKEISFINKTKGDPPFKLDNTLYKESIMSFDKLLREIETHE